MSTEDEKTNGEKKVGYKNPPEHTRFKKGTSGNLKGRPKRPKPPALSALDQELAMKVTLPNGSKVSKEVLIARATVNDAIRGDAQARKLIFQHMQTRDQRRRLAPHSPQQPILEARGGVMVVPAIIDVDEWESHAMKQQEELARRAYEDHEQTARANAELQAQRGR